MRKMHTILVCYATRYGSTKEIAGIIGDELRKAGHGVTVSPFSEVQDPGMYDAVVIGSPLYMGKWLAEGRDFVSRFRHPLRERPVAVFSVGYSLRERTREHLRNVDDALDTAVKIFLSPVHTGYFAGTVNPDTMTPADRAIVTMSGALPGDYRDVSEVRRWARELPAFLFPQGL
jgi:menaquinone-dependent protoporphyrinogen oxidase